MSEVLVGPFGELYELSTRFDPSEPVSSSVTLHDAESWSRTLDWIVDHPANLLALRRALMRAIPKLGPETRALAEPRLLELFTREVASGEIIVRSRARERPAIELLETIPEALTELVDEPPPESEPPPVAVVECILAAVAYECSHKGERKAGLRLEVGTAPPTRVLEVVAGDKGDGDIIKVKPEWTAAACGVHDPKVLVITGPGVRETLPNGDLQFEVYNDRIDTNDLLRYFWAWNQGGIDYVFAPQACTGHGVAATIRVYPALEVSASLSLMLQPEAFDDRLEGKLEKAQERGYHEKRGRPAHTEWQFRISGKVKYGNHSTELALRYQDKIRKWAAFNRLVKRAIDRCVELIFKYTGVSLRPLFPNLAVEYKGQYKEIKGKPTVGPEWSVKLKADPLIGIEIRIEILDLIIKALSKTQFAVIARGLDKVREWAKEREQFFEIWFAFQGLISGEIGAEKKAELARANVNGMIQGALKAVFSALASMGSQGWIGFGFGAEVKGNTGLAVRLGLDHDAQGVFLNGKFVLLECKFEVAAWASGKFIWEVRESYENEFKFWGEQDLLSTGNKYVLTSA